MESRVTDRELHDGQARRIDYLRLSLTDRCNFQCSYCTPPGEHRGRDRVTRPELARIVGIFAGLGIRRVRLTGGEPTLRPDLLDIVRDVHATPGIEQVALTTNGHSLATLAGPLHEAGLTRLNVSLDSLDAERLHRLAGRAASLGRIVAGLEAARRAGFESTKLNVVVIRGENETELGALTRFAWRLGATPRFIELMPFGATGKQPVSTAEVKALLAVQGIDLAEDPTRGWGPARHMRGTSTEAGEALSGLVGFIGAMTENFCSECNRVRVSADGALRACLGGRDRVPLAELLRAGASDAELAERIRAALLKKGDRHHMADDAGRLLPMVDTGG
jgi:cyclic pyranopterin phosphate synthase